MKDILKKFYNIKINDYEEHDEGIIFFYDSAYFYLCKCLFDEEYVENLNNFCLKNKNINLHSFVYNKQNRLVSDNYALLKINVFIENIGLDDIYRFQNIDLSYLIDKYVSFDKIWEYRIDYLEKQLYEISLNNLVNNSFDYFVGISEMLILFYKKNVNSNSLKLSLSHHTFKSMSTIDFYNPLNLSVDCVLKDVARYVKDGDDKCLVEIIEQNLTYEEKCYLFVRLIFPFEYFKEVSNILLDKKDEKKLLDIIERVDEYEEYILYVESLFNIYLFPWIKKSN